MEGQHVEAMVLVCYPVAMLGFLCLTVVAYSFVAYRRCRTVSSETLPCSRLEEVSPSMYSAII